MTIGRKIAAIMGVALMVAIPLAAIYLLEGAKKEHHNSATVRSATIQIMSQNGPGELVTAELIEKVIAEAQIEIREVPLNTISLPQIEQIIEQSGVVQRANVYSNYKGDLKIEVWPRKVQMRLMVEGYDSYITPQGEAFTAPKGATTYANIVTGEYTPLFGPKYNGAMQSVIEQRAEEIAEEIATIHKEQLMPKKEHREVVRKRLRSINRRYLRRESRQSREEYMVEVEKLRVQNSIVRDSCNKALRVIDSQIESVEQSMSDLRRERYTLISKRQEMMALIELVKQIEQEPQWRDEVTQIVLSEGEYGEMRVALVLKTAHMIVRLGAIAPRATEREKERAWEITRAIKECHDDKKVRLIYCADNLIPLTQTEQQRRGEEVRKHNKKRIEALTKLYEQVMPRAGWERYAEVSLEFEGQIVATPRRR